MVSILGNTRKADITFYRSGKINISARIAKLLSLAPREVVDIMSHNGEYYLYVKHRAPVIGRHAGMVHPTNHRGNHYKASSKALCVFMLNKCNQSDKVSLCVGEPINDGLMGVGLPIITKHCL